MKGHIITLYVLIFIFECLNFHVKYSFFALKGVNPNSEFKISASSYNLKIDFIGSSINALSIILLRLFRIIGEQMYLEFYTRVHNCDTNCK